MKKYILLSGLIASIVALSASNALAQDAATIYSDPTGTVVTWDNTSGQYPVIDAILSQAGATSGTHTYTSWSFLAQDGDGSLDVFGSLSGLGYTPTVGDAITLTGTYSPFHQIPEIETVTAITQISSGNTPAAPKILTIPTLNVATLSEGVAGHLIEVDNVTITGAGTNGFFPTYAQANTGTETFTMTDGSSHSMTLFDWVTSYSTCAAFGGEAVPTGPVDVIGFDSVFTSGTSSTAEFTPIEIISVPEPTTMGLCGAGGLLAMIIRLRRKV
jgi:hypothetical protein